MNDITRYFGIDWLAMLFTLLGIYFLGNKDRKGFIIMITGNACWIGVGALAGSLAMILANGVFLSMNLRGLIKWSKT